MPKRKSKRKSTKKSKKDCGRKNCTCKGNCLCRTRQKGGGSWYNPITWFGTKKIPGAGNISESSLKESVKSESSPTPSLSSPLSLSPPPSLSPPSLSPHSTDNFKFCNGCKKTCNLCDCKSNNTAGLKAPPANALTPRPLSSTARGPPLLELPLTGTPPGPPPPRSFSPQPGGGKRRKRRSKKRSSKKRSSRKRSSRKRRSRKHSSRKRRSKKR